MSNEELEPEWAFTSIEQHEIYLDKTRDGRYWRLIYWLHNDVLLQLRIGHTSTDDPDDFIAEMKLVGPEDTGCRSEEGFMTLGEFTEAPVALVQGLDPDLGEYPDTYRDEFITMVRYWGRVLEFMECGSKCRRSTPGPTSRGAGETHGMPERVRGGAGAVKKRTRREEVRTW